MFLANGRFSRARSRGALSHPFAMDITYIGCGVDYGKEKVSAICGDEATRPVEIANVIARHRINSTIRHIATELAESSEIHQYPPFRSIA